MFLAAKAHQSCSSVCHKNVTTELTTEYTLAELMVVSAAREIKDHEVVYVGMRLPLLAFLIAKNLHAPNAVGFYENGLIRETPASELLFTMGDPPNILGATQAGDMLNVMGMLQSGRVDIGFLGAGEVDKFGNLNSTFVSKGDGSSVRLPGSGGASDIASLAKRTVMLVEHSKRRLPERVSYLTSPGNGDGKGWRKSVGLHRGGPSCLITTMGVFRFDSDDCSARLESIHPEVASKQLQDETGWQVEITEPLQSTTVPSQDELALIRKIDPKRFWTA